VAVRRTVLRLGAVLVGLAALGVALPTLASSQQKSGKQRSSEPRSVAQKCCDVRIRDAGGTAVAGGQPASVTAILAAGRDGCTNVRPRVTVSLAGLDPDEIRIERVVRGTPLSLPVRQVGDGAVQAADPARDGLRLCGDGRANLVYRLTFLAGAPAGRATVSAEAGAGGGKVLGRDATVTVVQSLAAARPPAVEPPAAADNGAAAAGQAAPADQGAAPTSDVDSPSATEPAAAEGGSIPGRLSATVVATGLGALVAATLALVGVLALRQRRRGEGPDTGPTDPAGSDRRPDSLGRQPTLAARWSSLVATMRRPPGPVGGGS
jgi:hypothetical protein